MLRRGRATMTLAGFLARLDLLGPDLRRWPPAQAAQAEDLLAMSPEATQAIFEAIRLDYVLQAQRVSVDEAAVRRIVRQLAGLTEQPAGRWRATLRMWGLVPLWPRVGLLAAALALGVVVGSQLPDIRLPDMQRLGRVAWLMFDGHGSTAGPR
jgi:hypothetical protein